MADNFTMIISDGALGAGPSAPGRALLLIGVSEKGASSAVQVFESPADVVATLGYGPLSEMAAYALSVGSQSVTAKPVGCIRIPAGSVTAASTSSVTKVAGEPLSPSTGTLAISGTALDRFNARIRITRAGTGLTTMFRYSLDGGITESIEYRPHDTQTFVIPGTGWTVTFTDGAGPAFEEGDTFTWSSTAPSFGDAAITAALNLLLEDSRVWPLAMIVGAPAGADDAARSSAAASRASTVQTAIEAFAAGGRFMRALLDGPEVANDAVGAKALTDALAGVVARRVAIGGGMCRVPSLINARQMRVSSCWPYAARAASIPYSQDPGDGGLGPLEGIIAGSLECATGARSNFDNGRVFCLQSINGINGYVASNSAMLAPNGSDYVELPNCRVMDEASRAARAKLITYRRSRIRVAKAGSPNAGRIDERDAQRIETAVRSAVSRAVLDNGDAVDVQVVVNRTDNLLATNKLRARIRVTPFAYAKSIEVEIGLDNPALVGE